MAQISLGLGSDQGQKALSKLNIIWEPIFFMAASWSSFYFFWKFFGDLVDFYKWDIRLPFHVLINDELLFDKNLMN